MNRRSVLRVYLTALAGAASMGRHAAAQHHATMPPPASGDGKGVLIFAAATLKPALDAIASVYRTMPGGEVTIAYGPTPALAKQIENGAPADIFLSADPVWTDYLAEKRLIRRHTRVDLVRNTLILAGRESAAAKAPAVIDATFPLAQAVGGGPLCMCNPADHPAGRYAKASLQTLGLWDSVAAKIAIVENPQVAVAMVARGEAPAAVVFATDAKGVAGASVLGSFPEASHPPIVYPAALTMAAPHEDAAEHLLTHLRSPAVRALFDGYGYS
jgi:molybdate transport system substrate-binding protein